MGAAGTAGGVAGGIIGGAILAPILPPIGGLIGRWAGRALGSAAAEALANMMDDANEEAEDQSEEDAEEACTDCGETTLPSDPDDLVDDGWVEEPHPAPNRRRFRNPNTGEVLDFDQGVPGRDGWAGRDHYHRPNPNATGKGDFNLDHNGNPVPRGSAPSHIPPGTTIRPAGTGGPLTS